MRGEVGKGFPYCRNATNSSTHIEHILSTKETGKLKI
jgi:hypothetical protein